MNDLQAQVLKCWQEYAVGENTTAESDYLVNNLLIIVVGKERYSFFDDNYDEPVLEICKNLTDNECAFFIDGAKNIPKIIKREKMNGRSPRYWKRHKLDTVGTASTSRAG